MLAILAVAVIGAVAYTVRPRETPAPPPKIDRSDPTAVIEVQGGDAIQLKGKDQDLRVEYKVQTTNKDGETVLRDVKILVNNRAGRNYTVTGKQAFIGKQNASFDVRGDVKMETDDGLVATSQQATYTESERMVRIPGQVQFSQGRMTGSGLGFTFDEQRDVMWILDQADVKFAAKDNLGAMAFTAGTFGYARRDRYMRFEKTMHMDRDAQVIDADNAMVRLFPDREEPDYVELRGGASVTGSGASSLLKVMSAQDINLDYADDGRTLQNTTLAGKAEIQVASKGASGTQRMTGELMDIGLDPDGSLRHLSARDAVTVTLPASKTTAPRTIRSNSLTANGNAQGLRDMTFNDGVEYREPGVKGQVGRTVRAKTLVAGLDAAAGTLQTARFTGNVDFMDAPLHAISAEAIYQVEAGKLALLGQAPGPHIESDTVTIDAATIDVTLNPRTMTAKGNVRSTLLPPKKPAPGVAETRRPGLLTDKDPVSIISESLIYDEAARKADYTGKTVLFQGQTTINANALSLDEARGDLTASGKVVTNMVIANKEESPGAKTKPMVARAETFNYSDQTRTATYTTTAQLDGEQGNLSAGKLELKLAKDENTLQQLDANGAVLAVVDRRTVTGTRLSYSPSDDKYVAVGAPVKMIDAECQETIGKTLTFWKASDKVQVDGNNIIRTQTKGGGKCVAQPPQ